ncbi:MAG: dTDP-4-dehydrorhamnose reductase [Sphingobium limneticum]
MTRRYVVTGCEGQVVKSLLAHHENGEGVEILPLGRPELDLAQTDTIEPALVEARPDLIISAAAYTAVDKAEEEAENAAQINGIAVGEMGRVAARLGVPVVHLSTDYVFDGKKSTPYSEEDPVNPLGVYGRSKLDGERRLVESGADHVIVRTAWVYSPFGNNFLRTMLRLAQTREMVSVVSDQLGNPTSALDIADAVMAIANNVLGSAEPTLRGIFHMSGQGEANWAEFASEIFRVSDILGGPSAIVQPITTADYPTAAQRPNNSRMNCDKLAKTHNVRLPEWKAAAETVLRQMLADRLNDLEITR